MMVKLRVKGTGAGPAAAVGKEEKKPCAESDLDHGETQP